jgi:Tfp pilus assembly protein PilF
MHEAQEPSKKHPLRNSGQHTVTFLAVSCALVMCVTAPSALAQSDSDRATARALAEEGYNALRAQRYDVAEDRFRRADALVHAPTLVVDEGRALIGLGRYLDAQEKFELVLREGVPDTAPSVWKSAVAEAAKLREEVKPKVAWLTIVVPNVPHPRVTISGRVIPEAAIGVKFALNPGTQSVEVAADGFGPQTQSISLGEGSEQTIEITLIPLSPQKSVGDSKPKFRVTRSKDSESSHTAAHIAFGTGAVGIAVGAVTGFLALKKRSDLKSACLNGQCPQSLESTLKSYHSLGLVSGIGFAVGLVGAATGIVLLSSDGQSSDAKQAGTHQLQLHVGPSSIALQGAF